MASFASEGRRLASFGILARRLMLPVAERSSSKALIQANSWTLGTSSKLHSGRPARIRFDRVSARPSHAARRF